MYKIKQASEMLGVSIHTLRYYEKEGLTPFVKRENGVRIYSDDDIDIIRFIICLRDINMPIASIRRYMALYMMGDETIDQRREMINQYCEFVERKIKTMIETIQLTSEKISRFDKAFEDVFSQKKDFLFSGKEY